METVALTKQELLQHAVENPIITIRALNNKSFYHFFRFFWSELSSEEFKDNWHIRYICDQLQIVAERLAEGKPKAYDLLINVPPGTSKTSMVSIAWPVWCWTRWYWMKVIALSYSATLSLESAEYSRDLIRSGKFEMIYPEIQIKDDKDTKSNFRVVRKEKTSEGHAARALYGGNRFSTSVGGSLTGFHGHILIVDDPINPQQSVSETELRNTNRWLDQTLTTRKVDKSTAVTVMIMQRLHENDPTGNKLSKKNAKVKHICLPGEIDTYKHKVTPPELALNYVDNLLDPVRLSRSALAELEMDLGQYGYSGQIGQDPTSPTGGMFKVDHLTIIDSLPSDNSIESRVRYWDKAGTAEVPGKKITSAYTVGALMLKTRSGKFIVADIKRGRWSSEERETIIKAVAEADGVRVQVYIEQEPGSGGKESAEGTIKNLAGFSVNADRPTGDKIFRADPYSVQVNYGNVQLLRGAWNNEYVEELRLFPLSKYKDQTDASSGAFSKLTAKRRAGVR